MRVLLVHPNNKRNVLVGSYSVDPLGLEYIAAVLIQAGHQVRILSSVQPCRKVIHKELFAFRPNLVGFSVYTFTADLSLRLARMVKTQFPRTTVVFGGYHPTACPDTVKSPFVDFVIAGEGEEALQDLVAFLESGRSDYESIPGVFYWNGTLRGGRGRDRVPFVSLPDPVRSTALLQGNKVRQVIYPPISKQRNVAQVTYSRGCPHRCAFCASQLMFPGGVVWRSPSAVVRELEELCSRFGTNLVFFSDLTFNASKNKVHLLCDAMMRAALPMKWCALCRVDNIDEDLLSHMREAGCVKISYGIETLRGPASGGVKNYSRPGKEQFLRVISLTSEAGLLVRGLFILGFPWDNAESVGELVDFLRESSLDDIRLSFFAPFPGTSLYEECRSRGLLISGNYRDFNTEKPVVALEGGFHLRLQETRKEVARNFYGSQNYRSHYLGKVVKEPHLRESYWEYFQLLNDRDLMTGDVLQDLVRHECSIAAPLA